MGLRIHTNLASLRAQNGLGRATQDVERSMNRLATGLRIATAGDDASGLGISERLRARIRSQGAALRNIQDGISLVQTAEGALNEVSSLLVRLRELTVQSLNGTYSAEDRSAMNVEARALIDEIDRLARQTEFSGRKLLDDSTQSITIQVGADPGETIDVALGRVTSSGLRLANKRIDTTANALVTLTALDVAQDYVSGVRGKFGAAQNRLQSAYSSLMNTRENLSAAESRIRDVDVASETAELTRASIVQQAAVSVLMQANLQPALALFLLEPTPTTGN